MSNPAVLQRRWRGQVPFGTELYYERERRSRCW